MTRVEGCSENRRKERGGGGTPCRHTPTKPGSPGRPAAKESPRATTVSNSRAGLPSRSRLPPKYRGDPTRLNPEELFVAALASCQLLTYLALARGAGVTVRRYEERATGTLAIADRKMRMTEVLLRPRITVASGSDEGTGRGLVDKAHDGCFIANSVACAVRIEPEIVVEA